MGTKDEGDPAAPRACADPAYYARLLRPVFEGRRFVVLGDVLVGNWGLGRQLRALGAERPFLLGGRRGIGELPGDDEAICHSLGIELESPDVITAFRAYEGALRCLSDATRAELAAWDPEGRARCIGAILLGDVPEVAGRPRYAYRPSAWSEIEDKTRSPAFLASIGVRRGALAIVDARPELLRAAAARLECGAGTVWAGDSREGINGGGYIVRWVRDARSARQAEAFFPGRCDRVRVMPFLEGIPCSISGIVFPDGVAVFRPIETLALRRPDDSRFLYVGTASFWDPPGGAREQIRSIGRRVGEGLRGRVGLRGAYTVDGVLSEKGFVPTEVNTRIGASLNDLAVRVPDLPLHALALAAAEGEKLDYRPRQLEEIIVTAADARRTGWLRMPLETPVAQPRSLDVVWEGDAYRTAREGETADGVLMIAQSKPGGLLAFRPRVSRTPIGPSFAPRCVAALEAAERLFDVRVGPVEAARPVS